MFSTCFLAGSIAACGPGQESPEELTLAETRAVRILGDSALFRGHPMGAHIDTMVRVDRDYLFKRNLDALEYSIPFSRTDSAHFDVAYGFSDKRLYDIHVDVFLNSSAQKDSLFSALRTTLAKRHGAPAELSGYAHWEFEQAGHDIEVFLRDASDEHNRPLLTLHFTEPQIFIH